MQKNNKIINGFCYIDDDDMIFYSLYDEKKQYFDLYLFNKFIDSYSIDENHVILVNEENGYVTPLHYYKTKGRQYPKNMDIEKLIQYVYEICINVLNKR